MGKVLTRGKKNAFDYNYEDEENLENMSTIITHPTNDKYGITINAECLQLYRLRV